MSEQINESINDHNTLTQGGCLEVIAAAIKGEPIIRTLRQQSAWEDCKTEVTEWAMGKYVYKVKPARYPHVGEVWKCEGRYYALITKVATNVYYLNSHYQPVNMTEKDFLKSHKYQYSPDIFKGEES